MLEALAAVRWTIGPALALALTSTGGTRTDGTVSVATGDLRTLWALGERTVLEAGMLGRWQHDDRADRPSYLQAGIFVAVAYQSDLVFGQQEAAPRPPAP
jgi:hypothetical protein